MSLFESLDSNDVRIVADTHFRDRRIPGESERRERFVAFLDDLPPDVTLVLAGDIFDFYYEYRSVVGNRYLELLWAIRSCSARGVDVRFIGGNHDYWVGRFFSEELGVTVHQDEWRFEAQGRRVVVAHGDLVMPRDYGYKVLKTVLRNRAVIAVTRWIHPDILDWIARGVADGSRAVSHHNQEARARSVMDWAYPRFFERGNDVFVMGHVHHAVHEVRDGREFVILGDWFGGSSAVRIRDGRVSVGDAGE